ncbi:DNA mismatch endonuclease Vsr [Chlorobaculum thiosulfatiphilum]|jgi:DNA mismatch endonuclease (patch repair protein)|uniref:Very short patch repair endonuclease n=1 Tax=Chlorobaculum thiosulfatiphilum TaxID=115852 RepID=A0A5C4S5X7_CHLTI|nr:DNA mismatch endonuclease Vsr [Chlorobaculum thiosulfatiphilum]NTV82515.1 DNA mismatch endonuclease Vsr [Chlorobaculum sp.]TNJ38920.1 DNA mismatch endonuclease Vsr [Chlorobaculum thiosulfatiphilum]
MTDIFPNEKRSWIMSRVRGKNTSPEIKIRSLVHGLGFRFRLHRKDLPGKPDLVFPSRKKIIFVHGCFWHGHDCVRGRRVPKTNSVYWVEKIHRNIDRDAKHQSELQTLGWDVLVIWECEMRTPEILSRKILLFLQEK